MSGDRPPLTYAGSGVSLDASDAVVPERIRSAVTSTHGRSVLGGHGGFAGLDRRPSAPADRRRLRRRGDEVLLGAAADRHAGLGIDLVAMSVNDVLTSRCRPAFFMDMITCAQIDADVVAELVTGIAEGCRQAGCALLGGETAEHPDHDAARRTGPGRVCVAVAERRELVSGSRVQAGDTIVGLPSSGPHANGFSLVRRLLERAGTGLDDTPDALGGATVADALLEPTRIYARPIGELCRTVDVRAMAHITGGGIPGNLAPAVPGGAGRRARPGIVAAAAGVRLAWVARGRGRRAAPGLQSRARLRRGVIAPADEPAALAALERGECPGFVAGSVVEGAGVRFRWRSPCSSPVGHEPAGASLDAPDIDVACVVSSRAGAPGLPLPVLLVIENAIRTAWNLVRTHPRAHLQAVIGHGRCRHSRTS